VEEISLLQAVVNGGPALILAIGLVVVWRTWRSDITERRVAQDDLRQCLKEVQEQRVQDAQNWSEKHNALVDKIKETLVNLDNFTKTVEKVLSGGHNA